MRLHVASCYSGGGDGGGGGGGQIGEVKGEGAAL